MLSDITTVVGGVLSLAVLMHRLALGAFWLESHPALKKSAFPVLMHLMALGAF